MKTTVVAALVIAGTCVACRQRLEPASNFDSIEVHVYSGFGPSYHLLVSNDGVVTPWSDPKRSKRPCVYPIEREELILLSQLITQVPIVDPQKNRAGIGASLMDGERVWLKLRAPGRSWNVDYPTSGATSPIPLWVLALGNTMVELRRKYFDCERVDVPAAPPVPGREHVRAS